jgi:signal transduction histidine kinase
VHDAALAFLCHRDGTLLDVLHDELGLAAQLRRGSDFADLATPASARKAMRFLRTMRGSNSALDWQLSITLPNGVVSFYFSGCTSGTELLVVATKEPFSLKAAQQILSSAGDHGFAPDLLELCRRAAFKAQAVPGLDRVLSHLDRIAKPPPEPRSTGGDSELSAEQAQWLEIAAHDLRNPAAGILAACQYLLEDTASFQEHQVSLLKSIASSSRRLLRTIEDMLDIPVIDTGTMRLSRQATDLAALVEGVASAHRPVAQRRGIQLEVNAEAPIPKLNVDPQRLGRGIHSLLANAIRCSDAEDKVEIHFGTRGERAFITVLDGGPGVIVPDLKSLFAAANRGGRKPKLSEARRTMMLMSVRKMVERQGGEVEVQASPAGGSMVTLFLPVAAARRRPSKTMAQG